jgi:hypothetical protein
MKVKAEKAPYWEERWIIFGLFTPPKMDKFCPHGQKLTISSFFIFSIHIETLFKVILFLRNIFQLVVI